MACRACSGSLHRGRAGCCRCWRLRRSGASAPQSVPVGCDQGVDGSGQPEQGRAADQQSRRLPDPAGREEGPADGLGPPGSPGAGAVALDPPNRGPGLLLGQAQLLQVERLPRFHPGIGGQAGRNPAGRSNAESALPVIDKDHAPIFASLPPAHANWQRWVPVWALTAANSSRSGGSLSCHVQAH